MTLKLAFFFCLIFAVFSMEKHLGKTLLQQQKELDKSFEKLELKLKNRENIVTTAEERQNAREESLQEKEEMLEQFAEHLDILENTLKKREGSLNAAEGRSNAREENFQVEQKQMQQLAQDLNLLEETLKKREEILKAEEETFQEQKENFQKEQDNFHTQEESQKLLAQDLEKLKENLKRREQAAEENLQLREGNLKQMKESLYEWEERLIGQAKLLVNRNIDIRLIQPNDENTENVDLENVDHKQNIFVLTSTETLKPLNLYPNDGSITVFRDMETKEISWEDPKNLIPIERKEEIEGALQHSGETMANALFDSISSVFWNVLAEARPFVKELILPLSEHVELERRGGESSQTPLILAVKFDQEKAVATLIEREANLDAADKDLWTALHFAAMFGNKAACKILLQKGANVNAREKKGNTALHEGCKWGRVEVVKLLLEFGADTSLRNKFDNTALYSAHPKCADAIKAHQNKVKN